MVRIGRDGLVDGAGDMTRHGGGSPGLPSRRAGARKAKKLTHPPRLAIDGAGQILVAWMDSDGTTRNVHLARYDGTTWDTSFETISAIAGATPAAHPALVITPDGVPVLAWDELLDAGIGARPSTFIWKSNH